MSFIGGLFGGGGQPQSSPTSQTTFVREAPGIEERKIELMDIARQVAQKPVNLPDYQVAGLGALERQGIQAAGQTGIGSGAVGQGITGVQGAMAPVGAQQISQYLNPYQQYVTDEISRQGQMMQQQLGAKAIGAGAFGGEEKVCNKQNYKEELYPKWVEHKLKDSIQHYKQHRTNKELVYKVDNC
jgi:hypothetical protein